MFLYSSSLLLLELEVIGHHVIHEVVIVCSIDQTLSLVARVHGSPAELVISLLSLHEAPDGTTHHRYRLLVWDDEDLAYLVNHNSGAEELACSTRMHAA